MHGQRNVKFGVGIPLLYLNYSMRKKRVVGVTRMKGKLRTTFVNEYLNGEFRGIAVTRTEIVWSV